MKLNQIPREELELLSYTKIAELYLKEEKTTKNTAELFKEICNLLGLSEHEYQSKIADFFESLTTSKEFLLLEDGTWDLKENHVVKMKIEDIDESDEELEESDNEEDNQDPEEESEDDDYDVNDNDFIDDDDDLSDLTIVNDEEIED